LPSTGLCIACEKDASDILSFNRNTGMCLANVGKVLRNLVPVDNVPPVAHIFRSTVLVLNRKEKEREGEMQKSGEFVCK
jgi:hypothetical protein